jgi:hypothetical protein
LTPYSTWDWAKTIIQHGNSFIIQGETFNEFGWRIISTLKIDSLGNELWVKYLGDTVSEHAIGFPGSLKSFDNHSIFSIGNRRTYTSNWVHDRGLLVKYDEEFDTVWTKEFGEESQPYDTSYIFWNFTKTTESGFIITGATGTYGNIPSVYLMKTDSNGNKVWDHKYSSLWEDTQGYSVIQTTDGGYAIGAFQYAHIPINNQSGEPLVVKTDSIGNLQWVRNLGGEYMDTHAIVTNSSDGNILVLSAYADSISGGDEWAKKIHITKLTNDNQIVFDRMYNRKLYMLYPLNISCNPDGSIITAGTTGTTVNDYPHMVGWIFKTTADGDSVWYREYNLLHERYSSNVLYDVKETPDMGYIACGYVHPVLPDTGTQDVWVIKVDSLGCEQPDWCWVGIKEQSAELLVRSAGELWIYPNPAHDVITVSGFGKTDALPEIELIDLFGRRMIVVLLNRTEETVTIDASELPPGLYFITIRDKAKVVGTGKVILN